MSSDKLYEKVFFEMYSKKGYKGRWVYSQRHSRFAEKDVPDLFNKRPYQEKEIRVPEYLYRLEPDGIHIELFYDGIPKEEKGEGAS